MLVTILTVVAMPLVARAADFSAAPACAIQCVAKSVAANPICGGRNNACAAAAVAGGKCNRDSPEAEYNVCLAKEGCIYIDDKCICSNDSFQAAFHTCLTSEGGCSEADQNSFNTQYTALCEKVLASPDGTSTDAPAETNADATSAATAPTGTAELISAPVPASNDTDGASAPEVPSDGAENPAETPEAAPSSPPEVTSDAQTLLVGLCSMWFAGLAFAAVSL